MRGICVPSGLNPYGTGGRTAIGDTTLSMFFTPKHTEEGHMLWGAGPIFYLPTASDEALKTRKWGLGPAFVGLKMQGPWVYGGLISNVTSVGGGGTPFVRRINLMTIQPFVNYNFGGGWALASVPIITANWEANGNKWTIPLGGGVSKSMKWDKLPVNAQVAAY